MHFFVDLWGKVGLNGVNRVKKEYILSYGNLREKCICR